MRPRSNSSCLPVVAPWEEMALRSWSESAGSVMASSYSHISGEDPDADSVEVTKVYYKNGAGKQQVKGRQRYSKSEGFVCLNSEQQRRPWDDYKVMLTCSGTFCSECRTNWFDHDDPTVNRDYEVLSVLLTMYPRDICPQPIAIEAQTHSGQPASDSGYTLLIYDATYRFACVNADQRSGSCKDNRIRFTCPAEFCQVSEECGTCIEAQTTYRISAQHTGDTFLSYDVTFGFVCINSKQKDVDSARTTT
ncbi:hypothetical protein J4Q44_G00215910 [Coregonus suidteri]|uniref:WxxW domain-containing protein n=1 Tax=Coregonus suidteri TaxID=861788 RepID=A0AAN8LKI3_9TELE